MLLIITYSRIVFWLMLSVTCNGNISECSLSCGLDNSSLQLGTGQRDFLLITIWQLITWVQDESQKKLRIKKQRGNGSLPLFLTSARVELGPWIKLLLWFCLLRVINHVTLSSFKTRQKALTLAPDAYSRTRGWSESASAHRCTWLSPAFLIRYQRERQECGKVKHLWL